MVQSQWQLDVHGNAYGSNYIKKDFAILFHGNRERGAAKPVQDRLKCLNDYVLCYHHVISYQRNHFHALIVAQGRNDLGTMAQIREYCSILGARDSRYTWRQATLLLFVDEVGRDYEVFLL